MADVNNAPAEHPSFATLRECEAYLQTTEYAALDQDHKDAFRVKYMAAVAAARTAAGRR